MKKKILFVILTAAVILLALSATVEFSGMLRNFAIKSKVQLWFLVGFVAYLVVHFVFYKPVFIHVMSHELTHIFWAAVFGGKTRKLEVSSRGGRVMISKSNFFISLAPYFFPLYTFIIALIYFIAKEAYYSPIAFFLGASLSFHIALTLYSLRVNQSDFYEDSNVIFSVAFVYFMNVLVIALIFSMLSEDVSFIDFIKGTVKGTYRIFTGIFMKIDEILK